MTINGENKMITYKIQTKYICDLCNFETVSEEEIKKHVAIPNKGLPIGFVFNYYDVGYRLWRPAVLVKEGRVSHNHTREFDTWYYEINGILQKSIRNITLLPAQDGEMKIYSEREFEEVKPIAEGIMRLFNKKEGSQLNLTLIRTTPELEQLVGEK